MRYEERSVNADGTFANAEDTAAENRVRDLLERAWGVDLVKIPGRYAPTDFTIWGRDNQYKGEVEIKHRSHGMHDFDTVFFNHRKRKALQKVADAGASGIFVVEFTDGVLWIDIKEIDTSNVAMGGCARPVKGKLDVEEVIHIPISSMHSLEG